MTTTTKGKVRFTRKTIFVGVAKALNGEIDDVLPTTPLKDIARGYWEVGPICYNF